MFICKIGDFSGDSFFHRLSCEKKKSRIVSELQAISINCVLRDAVLTLLRVFKKKDIEFWLKIMFVIVIWFCCLFCLVFSLIVNLICALKRHHLFRLLV